MQGIEKRCGWRLSRPIAAAVIGWSVVLGPGASHVFAETATNIVDGVTVNYSDTYYYVGNTGPFNVLIVTNAGRLNCMPGNVSHIGKNESSDNNSALVTGAGSYWRTGYLNLGLNGAGNSLTITNGGVVDTSGTYVGYEINAANNRLIVTGPGSRLTSEDSFMFGEKGQDCQLTISNGGRVTVDDWACLGKDLLVNVNGHAVANNAVALVTGSGSIWSIANAFYVGWNGVGNQLTIAAGGEVRDTTGVLGDASDSDNQNNRAIVTGTNSKWINSGWLVVGNTTSGNHLTITNGGLVVNVDGSLGNSANPDGHSADNNTVLVTGSGSVWTNSGSLYVGRMGVGNSVTVSSGGAVCVAGNAYISYDSLATNNQITVNGGCLTVTNSGGTGTLDVRRGSLTFNGGTLAADQLIATNGARSAVTFTAGTLSTKTTAVTNGSPFTVGNGTSAATLNLQGGTHQFANGLVIAANAQACGAATVDASVTSSGLVAPGTSVGTLAISSNYTQNASGSLKIELGGVGSNDVLSVGGTAQLGGTLNVTNVNGFTPAPSNAFTILMAQTVAGTFGAVNLPALGGGLHWTVLYSPTSVILRVEADIMTTYVATNGLNVAPYDTWANAATTIQAAIDAVASGGTVWVSNGVYAAGGAANGSPAMSNRVVITKAVTVQSVNGPSVTFIKGAADPATGGLGTNATRCVFMSAGLISGFTLTNGYTRTDADWNTQQGGGGALLRGGVISNCVVTACVSSHFAGGLDLFGGDAWNCIIFENSSYDGGGLVLQGSEAFNCLARNNRASNRGGGVFFWQTGTLGNCTVAGNSATNSGGGVYCYQGGSNLNTIVYANTANGVPNNWAANAGGAFAYSCTTPNPGGTGNTTGDPLFLNLAAGDCRIRAGSSCYNHGLNAFAAGATDLAGHPRIIDTTVDMGAYEIAFPSTTITNTVTSVPWNQSSIVIGGTNNAFVTGAMSYANEASGASGTFPAQPRWTAPPISLSYGQNPISVTVSNDEGETWSDNITVTRQMPTVAYVAPGGSNVWPYDSWATAATTIQPSVDSVPAGGTVWVSNGVYAAGGKLTPFFSLSNRVCITASITVQSVNGPSKTFIVGAGPVGPNAVRCAYLSAGTLAGFTLTNGNTLAASSSVAYELSGGGAMLDHGGTLSNCVLTGCSAADGGGGALCYYDGTLNACTLRGNASSGVMQGDGGGGVFCYMGGTLNDCTISGNTSHTSTAGGGIGGGAWCDAGGTLNACTIVGNISEAHGGGAALGSGATLYNCVVSSNSAASYGGGAFCFRGGVVNNTLLQGNTAGSGGGVYAWQGGTLNNCTVAGNAASDSAGGVFCYKGGTMLNAVVYANTMNGLAGNWATNAGGAFAYCCTAPNPGGSGNVTNNPLFANAAAGNYRLASGSPCVNAGNNAYAQGATDLDGNPRIIGGVVDMGAYECTSGSTANGIPWSWLLQYGLATDGSADHQHSDTDTFDNGQEHIADTIPTNAASYFRITAFSNSPAATVSFDSSANRSYTLIGVSNLTSGAWSPIPGAGPRLGSGGADALSDTNVPPRGPFYRLKVELP